MANPQSIEGILADHGKRLTGLETEGVKAVALGELEKKVDEIAQARMEGAAKNLEKAVMDAVKVSEGAREKLVAELGALPGRMANVDATAQAVRAELGALTADLGAVKAGRGELAAKLQ